MDSKHRYRREAPARSQPNRGFGKMFDQTDPHTHAHADDEHADASAQSTNGHRGYDRDSSTESGASFSDTVSQSVNLGYRVIDEQIRQGKKVAEKLSNQSYDFANVGGDVQDTFKRMADNYTELMSLSLGLVNTVSKDFGSTMRNAAPTSDTADRSQADTTTTSVNVAVRVHCAAAALVTLKIQTGSGQLHVDGLRDTDPAKPVISDIQFHASSEVPLSLEIRVATDQPAGTYHGVVSDLSTNNTVGTVTLRIDA